MKHETRKINELSIHPLLKESPMLDSSHPDCLAIRECIQANGLNDSPIKINGDNQIIDGRHRVREAEVLGLEHVPVIMVSNDKICDVITDSLFARRHLLKWQIAYCLFPIIEAKFGDGKARRLENLKKGIKPGKSSKSPMNPRTPCGAGSGEFLSPFEAFLRTHDISEDIWERILKIRIAFKSHPELRDKLEHRMFSHDAKIFIGPEGVMKAIGTITGAYGSDEKPDLVAARNDYPRLINQWLGKTTAQFKFWEKISSSQREKVTMEIAETISLWPKEVLSVLKRSLKG